MAQTPDVRVRLSAEGVQEVIAAMKRIQDEAKKTDGVKALQKGFADLRNEMLGGLGVAAAVAGIVEMGKKAMENTVAIGLMSQKVGTTTETLSVLTVAAEDASVSQEDLFNGIQKLAKAQDQAAQGSTKQVDAFKRLGISIKDIKANDPGQMFVLVAQKLSQVESGSARAAIAQTLLGKSGANLIPVMKELANGGFEQVQAKAQRMGLVLSDDTVKSIEKAHAALIDLGHIAEGVATQFEAGFLPKAADAMEQLGTAISGDGVNGMKKLGEYVGEVANYIAYVFVVTGHIIGAQFAAIITAIQTQFESLKILGSGAIDFIKKAATGDIFGAATSAKLTARDFGRSQAGGFAGIKGIYSGLEDQLITDYTNYQNPTPAIGDGKKPKGSGGDAGNLTAIAKARAAFLEAQATKRTGDPESQKPA